MYRTLLPSLVLATLLLTACTESDEPNTEANAGVAEVQSYAQVTGEGDLVYELAQGEAAAPGYANVIVEAAAAQSKTGCVSRVNSSRTLVTINGTTYRRVEISFNGNTCIDGRSRSGKIVTEWAWNGGSSDSLVVARRVYTVNYRVNNLPVSVHVQQVFNGANLTLTVQRRDTITNAANQRAWVNTNHVWTWTNGINTPFVVADDKYSVTGAGTGKGFDTPNYAITIEQALLWDRSCNIPQFTQGILRIKPVETPAITINYGAGACDGEATVQFLNRTEVITLPRF